MTKSSNKNPEIILNFKLITPTTIMNHSMNPEKNFRLKETQTISMKNPIIPTFCNSEFNPQIANVTDKIPQFTVIGSRIPQAQDCDGCSLFLKNSTEMMINKMMMINGISQIDDDEDDGSRNLSNIFG